MLSKVHFYMIMRRVRQESRKTLLIIFIMGNFIIIILIYYHSTHDYMLMRRVRQESKVPGLILGKFLPGGTIESGNKIFVVFDYEFPRVAQLCL